MAFIPDRRTNPALRKNEAREKALAMAAELDPNTGRPVYSLKEIAREVRRKHGTVRAWVSNAKQPQGGSA